ncbi:uncharacterized protein LOC121599306 [Anopheles merus]|uniref:DUF4806 domain-containing protein n=1 Tax=Anopheles merus TaxID=30066 RepID=A0A9I3MH89_ANOME|nr:uncharacterized protein LOC121599306 [Anopheles merus]
MPYAIVEIVDARNGEVLLAVPETWLIIKTKVIGYLYWPDAELVENMKQLLADDRSAPPKAWGKRICKIVYRSIASLTAAERTTQILQKNRKTTVNVAFNSNAAITMKTVNVRKDTSSQMSSNPVPKANQPSSEWLKNSSFNKTSAVKQDLLGPSPKLLKLDPSNSKSSTVKQELKGTETPKRLKLDSSNCVSQQKDNENSNILSLFSTEQDYDPFEDIGNLEEMLRSNHATPKSSTQKELPILETKNPDIARNEPKDDAKDKNKKIFGLLQELKCMINANQEEIGDSLNEGIQKMETNFDSCKRQPLRVESHKGNQHPPKTIRSETPNQTEMYRLTTVEDVDRFEHRLNDRNFLQRVRSWVKRIVAQENEPEKCMKRIWDLMFDEALFKHMCWVGSSSKIALRDYFNIIDLYKYGGTTNAHRVNDTEVRKFLYKTMKYVTDMSYPDNYYVKKAVNAKCGSIRKPASRMSINVKEQIKAKHQQQQGQSKRDNEIVEQEEDFSNKKDGLQNVPEQQLPTICVGCIKSVEVLNAFENRLNDEKRRTEMQTWVDKTVGHEANVERRMEALLERLIDTNILLNFCWMNVSSRKCSLLKFKNVVRLFEYASRTKLQNTIIYNHGIVSSFFIRTLDNVA